MDNEKTSGQNQNRKKHRHQKPKGYFIDPNGEKLEKVTVLDNQNNTQKSPKTEGAPEKREANTNQNHQHKTHCFFHNSIPLSHT